MQLAEDMGIKVERRPIPEEELETFEEAGACGTAAVISPIQRIDDLENGKSYVISKDGKPGPICTKLYNKLRGNPVWRRTGYTWLGDDCRVIVYYEITHLSINIIHYVKTKLRTTCAGA